MHLPRTVSCFSSLGPFFGSLALLVACSDGTEPPNAGELESTAGSSFSGGSGAVPGVSQPDRGASVSGGTTSGNSGGTGNGGLGAGGGGPEGCSSELRAPYLEGYANDVTGGDGGDVVTASTGTEIHAAICNREATDTPLIIMVDGVITPGNTKKQSGSCNTDDGRIELKQISNVSLIGVERGGVLDQVGIHIRESSNIIIQNLTIKNVRKSNTSTPSNGGDAIGMEVDVNRIWIDHNEIHGYTTEGEEHDGLIDFKDETTNVTVSYNHLHDSGRGGLVASNDSGDDGSTNITFHHNWYQRLDSRTHLVREADAHFYNNYFVDILSTGINARNGASLLIENNYFTEATNPLGTFYYVQNPGTWEVHDNYWSPTVVWDASDDELPAGPDVQSTGLHPVPYGYSLDPVDCVPEIVQANAGVGKL